MNGKKDGGGGWEKRCRERHIACMLRKGEGAVAEAEGSSKAGLGGFAALQDTS